MSKRNSPPGGKSGQAGDRKGRSEQPKPRRSPPRSQAALRPRRTSYFDADIYASEFDERQAKRVFDISRGFDELTHPTETSLFYERYCGDMLHVVGQGYLAIKYDAKTEKQAQRIAAKTEAALDNMIAEYRRAAREAFIAHFEEQEALRQEAVRKYPDLEGKPILILGNWAISGESEPEAKAKPKPTRRRSMYDTWTRGRE